MGYFSQSLKLFIFIIRESQLSLLTRYFEGDFVCHNRDRLFNEPPGVWTGFIFSGEFANALIVVDCETP